MRHRLVGIFFALALAGCSSRSAEPRPPSLPPASLPDATVMFVTQTPLCAFGTTTSTFGNHRGAPAYARRGGDLYVRYPDGSYDPAAYPGGLRNLTREAGFGASGLQGATAIAVREPAMHWSGEKAVFAMAIGGADERYASADGHFALYEITGFGIGQIPVITKVANQPEGFDNVSPTYGTDGSILFVSDRPRDGLEHLHPLLDEYELNPIVEGIYRLGPDHQLELVEESPSGAFSPFVDAWGRVVFTKWDHLRMDGFGPNGSIPKGGIDFASEAASATPIPGPGTDAFPERPNAIGDVYTDAWGRMVHTHDFNQFMPWEMNEDGSHEETQNHLGRHELGGSFAHPAFVEDPSLSYLNPVRESNANQVMMAASAGLFGIRQDPISLEFCGTYALEFSRASAGQIVCYAAPPEANPESIALRIVTSTGVALATHGLYRNPVRLATGETLAAHTLVGAPARPTDAPDDCVEDYGSGAVAGDGIDETPLRINYGFRLRRLVGEGDVLVPGAPITPGIIADVAWYDGSGARRTYSGPLWELDPVEVRARPQPQARERVVDAPESAVIASVLGPHALGEADLVAWMRAEGLGLVVTRNVTSRDRADRSQPFNLAVALPGGIETRGDQGILYLLSGLQIFQADRVRGYDPAMSAQDPPSPIAGRRALAVPLHDAPAAINGDTGDGTVPIALDGSAAAFVPARRALTWHTVGPDGRPVVRERNWIDVAPGEIRGCPSCHGVNVEDQAGNGYPTNEPLELRALLERWVAATNP